MTDLSTQRIHDAEEHQKSYEGIMGASIRIALPVAMGLAMFFTQLVMGNGIFALVAGIGTAVFVHIIVKLFFSH
ncbi:MAG: hypothetical protein JKX88_11060 [Marinicaulis sp.]|nr:hypothetical protein [Marinicaulis sp.]